MGERFKRLGQQLSALLLFPFRFLMRLFSRAGRWLLARLRRFGRFIGRVGLAERNLLVWFIWEPFLYLLSPLRRPMRWLWRFLGRMGLALRKLLTWFIWRPSAWLHRHTLRPLLAALGAFARARWQAGAARRAVYRRRLASRWLLFRARQRLALRRPKRPAAAVIAPRAAYASPGARLVRFASVFISVSAILAASFVTWQDRQPDQVVAVERILPRVIILTPSPQPATPTPAATKPSVEIKLTPWPTPDPLSRGGTVAFTLSQNGNSDIYLLAVGEAEPLRLTSHPAPDRDPAWSPDGRELAFASRRDGNWDIYVYNLPEQRLRRITNHPGYDGAPGWSPDGQWLVFESYRNNNLDIYIVKADLSEGPYRLTEHPAPDYAPAWSPAGRHIAFTSWRTGARDIFMMALDQVSDETAVNLTASPATHEDAAAFSPDGRYLAYHQDTPGFSLIYALPLTNDYGVAGPPASLNQQGRQPVWSPDSTVLVYVHDKEAQSYLIAGSPAGWGVAPQAYAADGRIDKPSWTAVNLTPEILAGLENIDGNAPGQPLFVEAMAPPEASEEGQPRPPVSLFQIAVSAPSPYLSDRVDQSFLALRQRVLQEAGWDFLGQLDNMFEAIGARPAPGMSGRTWNKAGRAFDLPYREVLAFEPRIEVVREDVGSETYWRVYVRTAAQDGTQGEPLRALPWDFRARTGEDPRYYDQGGKLKDAIPPGYYVDFTALAADYGWTRAPADGNWRTYFPAIRFWHFQNRQGLTWEEAILELYTAEEFAAVFKE